MDNRRRLSSTEIAVRIRRGPTENAFSGGFRGVCRQTGVIGKPEKAAAGVPRAEITSGGLAR